MNLVEILKALSDENRMRILNLLRKRRLCVGELQTILGLSQPNVSKHLNKLKSLGLIEVDKKGQTSYHALNQDTISSLDFLSVLIHSDLDGKFENDDKRLDEYSNSGLSCEDLRSRGFNLK